MDFLKTLSELVERLGTTAAGICLMIGGVIWVLPYFGIPAYIAQGIGLFGAGLGIVALGKRAKKSDDLFVSNAAEIRRKNPNLPNSSDIPAVQREIEIQASQAYRNTKP